MIPDKPRDKPTNYKGRTNNLTSSHQGGARLSDLNKEAQPKAFKAATIDEGMCRMAVLIGQFNDAEETIVETAEALAKAASMDPYGDKLYGEKRHRDGWGGFLFISIEMVSP